MGHLTPAQLIARFERLWPTVQHEIPAAQVRAAHLLTSPITVTDLDRMRLKAQRGWLEHDAGIMDMTTDQMLVEARAEMDDLMVYLAWRAARLRGLL